MKDNESAGDGNSYSQDWAELERVEQGQADAPPANEAPVQEVTEGEDSGQPAPQGDEAGKGPDAEAQPKPTGSENADDIWASAPAALREAFERERAGRAQAENTIRSNTGRWSAAQRELNRLRAEPPAPKGDAAQGNGAAEAGSDDRDEALRRVEEEYPDIAKPLIGVIGELRAEVARLSTDATRRTELDRTQAELSAQESMAREEQALAQDHPDWNDVVKSQDFADWAISQPRMVHEALVRNGEGIVDGAEAAKILSDFKRDKGLTPAPPPPGLAQKRDRQLEASRHVPARQGAAPGEGQGGDYASEWKRQANEESRREARR